MQALEVGLFVMPAHPPERSVIDGHNWDLSMIRAADRFGYKEAWVGEHLNTPWEPCPSPELVIAQALTCTEQITLGAGAHILPNHHPARLAQTVAYLDHLAEGRYMLGIGAGGGGSELFGYSKDAPKERYAHLREALEIMVKLWTEPGPWEYVGHNWHVTKAASPGDPNVPSGQDLTPYQKPHPPIGVPGLTPDSESMRVAGEIGGLPMSLYLNNRCLRTHWETYSQAAEAAGHEPDRAKWRVGKEVLIADTDEEAIALAAEGMMGRFHSDYFFGIYSRAGRLANMKSDESLPDSDFTAEYRARNEWLVGSPDTVAEKLGALYEDLGGFGTLLVVGNDYSDDSGPWMESMERLTKEVVPTVNRWIGADAAHSA